MLLFSGEAVKPHVRSPVARSSMLKAIDLSGTRRKPTSEGGNGISRWKPGRKHSVISTGNVPTVVVLSRVWIISYQFIREDGLGSATACRRVSCAISNAKVG